MVFETQYLESASIQLIDGDRGANYPKQEHFQTRGHCLFLSAKNVTASGFAFEEKIFIDSNRDDLLRAGKLQRGDVVLTTRGTIGNVAFYSDDVDFEHVRINSGMMILRADSTIWNRRFLYFLFASNYVKEQISALTSGSAVPQLPARDLKKFRLPVIKKEIQDAIDKVVGDISGKIDLNRRINQTLEAMAQAIFKSWFVDFDPVKAKIAAKEKWLSSHPSPSGRGAGGEGKPRLPQTILAFARENRANATDAEALMWQLLRNQQLGAKFRRQHPLPPYIVDFYCHEHRLAIELDGGQHFTPDGMAADAERTAHLQQQGIEQVLRFSNREVFLETEAVLEQVWAALNPSALTPTPLPEGEGLEDQMQGHGRNADSTQPSEREGLEEAMLRAAMRAISGKTDAELDALKLLPSTSPPLPLGEGPGVRAGGEGATAYDDLATTAALFPDEMEESELGEIPRGWGVNQISQFGDVVCGKTPSKTNPEYFGGGIPFIKIPDMHDSIYVVAPSERLSESGVASQAKKTLPPGSICVSCIATVGKVVITHEPSQTNQQINSIVPRSPQYTSYLYFQMLEKEKEFHDLASGGSATLNMNTSTFSKVNVVAPKFDLIEKFDALVAPLFRGILLRQRESAFLSETRDTLLPKLLSGELAVSSQDASA